MATFWQIVWQTALAVGAMAGFIALYLVVQDEDHVLNRCPHCRSRYVEPVRGAIYRCRECGQEYMARKRR